MYVGATKLYVMMRCPDLQQENLIAFLSTESFLSK